LPLPG